MLPIMKKYLLPVVIAALAAGTLTALAVEVPLDTSLVDQIKSGPLNFASSSLNFSVGNSVTGEALQWNTAGSNAMLQFSNGIFGILSSSGGNANLLSWFATTTGLYSPNDLVIETNPAVNNMPIGSSTLSIRGLMPNPDRCVNSGIMINCAASTPNASFYQNPSGTENGILFNAYATSTPDRTIINWDWNEFNPNASSFGILFGGSLGNGLGIAVAGPKPNVNDPQVALKNRFRYGIKIPFASSTNVTIGAPTGEATFAFHDVGFQTTKPAGAIFLDLNKPDEFFKIFPGQTYSAEISTYIGSSNTYNVGQYGYLNNPDGTYEWYVYQEVQAGGRTLVRANDINVMNPMWSGWWASTPTTDWKSQLQSVAVQCGQSPASANLIFWPATSSLAQANGCSRLKQEVFTGTTPTGSNLHYLMPQDTDPTPTSGYYPNSWATCPKGFFANVVGDTNKTANGVVPIIQCEKLWQPF